MAVGGGERGPLGARPGATVGANLQVDRAGAGAMPENTFVTMRRRDRELVPEVQLSGPCRLATACCGIELMSVGASRFVIARFGAEVMRSQARGAVRL